MVNKRLPVFTCNNCGSSKVRIDGDSSVVDTKLSIKYLQSNTNLNLTNILSLLLDKRERLLCESCGFVIRQGDNRVVEEKFTESGERTKPGLINTVKTNDGIKRKRIFKQVRKITKNYLKEQGYIDKSDNTVKEKNEILMNLVGLSKIRVKKKQKTTVEYSNEIQIEPYNLLIEPPFDSKDEKLNYLRENGLDISLLVDKKIAPNQDDVADFYLETINSIHLNLNIKTKITIVKIEEKKLDTLIEYLDMIYEVLNSLNQVTTAFDVLYLYYHGIVYVPELKHLSNTDFADYKISEETLEDFCTFDAVIDYEILLLRICYLFTNVSLITELYPIVLYLSQLIDWEEESFKSNLSLVICGIFLTDSFHGINRGIKRDIGLRLNGKFYPKLEFVEEYEINSLFPLEKTLNIPQQSRKEKLLQSNNNNLKNLSNILSLGFKNHLLYQPDNKVKNQTDEFIMPNFAFDCHHSLPDEFRTIKKTSVSRKEFYLFDLEFAFDLFNDVVNYDNKFQYTLYRQSDRNRYKIWPFKQKQWYNRHTLIDSVERKFSCKNLWSLILKLMSQLRSEIKIKKANQISQFTKSTMRYRIAALNKHYLKTAIYPKLTKITDKNKFFMYSN